MATTTSLLHSGLSSCCSSSSSSNSSSSGRQIRPVTSFSRVRVSPALASPSSRVCSRRAGASRSRAAVTVRCSAETTRAARKGAPPLMPVVMTPSGFTDLSSLLLRNRIIFVGQPVNAQVAQRVISQLLTLAAIDENEEIKMYINCPGGSTYSILAIYDTMSWIKPKISTVCFGIAASQGALLLAGGEKGRRFAMPNARIMIHQPQGGCGGTADDVRKQVNEIMQSRSKIDKMYAAFTGQPLERVQQFTDRDRFFAASEAMEFGLIDGLLETEY